jgi:putative transcriptional regulator
MTNNLKVWRAKFSYTQQDLAGKIQVSRQTINAMEKGKYVPSTVLALRLSTIFETSVLEIFSLEGSDWD